MVYRAISGHHGRQGIIEHAIPLRIDQIRGDRHAAPLLALSEQDKGGFHLVAIMLRAADVFQEQAGEAIVKRTT